MIAQTRLPSEEVYVTCCPPALHGHNCKGQQDQPRKPTASGSLPPASFRR
ncbi:MAG: hypothetical protein ACRD1J_10700 [Terriglobia bacterium]